MRKTFFWLKLKTTFFNQREVKKLRRLAGGDTLTIIYLKLMLLSLSNSGVLVFYGTEESFSDQLSLEIDESSDDISMTLGFLKKNGLLSVVAEDQVKLEEVSVITGKECDSAERVRRFRAKQTLQSNASSLPGNKNVTTEKELELEKDKDFNILAHSLDFDQPKKKTSKRRKCLISQHDAKDVVIEIPCIKGVKTDQFDSAYQVTKTEYECFCETYPAVDIEKELKAIKAWNFSNSKKRKTHGGMLRHINTWLSNAQNKPTKTTQEKKSYGEEFRENAAKFIAENPFNPDYGPVPGNEIDSTDVEARTNAIMFRRD